LVFPTRWEGFGIPALEAMACGTPVITSNLASLPEVTGDAALLIDPEQPRAIADAMVQVATDDRLWQELHQRSLDRASQFSWAKTAAQTQAVLRQLF
jgi:glycosyltransferase involved in cell wall biosynthesis